MRALPCESRLTSFALCALEEAAAQAHKGPVRRAWGLRLALAYLASRTPQDHEALTWAFDTFWRSLAASRPQERWGSVNAALNGIYLGVGRRRDLAVVSEFERKIR